MLRLATLFVLAAAVLPLSFCHADNNSNYHHRHEQHSKSLTVLDANLADQVPSCAINCLSVCSEGDATCICRDDTLRSESASCVQASCIFSDILKTQNYTQTMCEAPVRDKTVGFRIMNITLGLATLLVVGLRFFSKWLFGHRYGFAPDDWVMFVICGIGIPCIVLNDVGLVDHGLGKDVWTLHAGSVSTFMRYFFVLEIFYIALMMLVKLNLSLFYLDLFPSMTFRRLIWATIAFHVTFCIAFVAQAFFQCLPLKFFWTQFSDKPGQHDGHCINLNAAAWANAVINVVGDIWLISIPVFQLHRLDLHWKKKVGAAIMFMTGFFVTIVSIIRLSSLNGFGSKSTNPTWEQYDIVWWSTIEVNIGVMCTCLPAIRIILAHMFPHIIGASLSAIPGHNKPRTPERPSRTEQEDIELCSNDFTEEGKSTTKASEISVSVRTHGSEEIPRTVLPINQAGGSSSSSAQQQYGMMI
ncbi:hypothetical protein PT974_01176 [Cladobotryum mycophilum]|uniref:CFEM domain-containing protein n=1 Tax=Cladobotryum mycophilum TaxID=491253 RepID=A0ABR0T2Y6_9HYPO